MIMKRKQTPPPNILWIVALVLVTAATVKSDLPPIVLGFRIEVRPAQRQ
jgi:hypothetical protein